MYDVGRKPTKSQAYARVICHIAVKERNLKVLPMMPSSGIQKFVMPDSAKWQSGRIGRHSLEIILSHLDDSSMSVVSRSESLMPSKPHPTYRRQK